MIDLPSIESQFGRIKIERTIDDMFDVKVDGGYIGAPEKHIVMRFPLLWTYEKTKDYVVMWYIRYGQYLYLVYSRKGDNRWKHGNYCNSGTFVYDMVYKDHKIYLYTDSRDVKVLDFSRDIPRKIFETKVKYDYWRGVKGIPRRVNPGDVWFIKETHLVVTLSGEALRVKSIIRSDSDVWSFRIYKMDSSNRNREKLSSLGDEAILLDLRITVLANAIERINRNSIYFSGYRSGHPRAWSEKDILIFNLDTHEVERPHQSILSSIQSSDARWFVPNFKNEHD